MDVLHIFFFRIKRKGLFENKDSVKVYNELYTHVEFTVGSPRKTYYKMNCISNCEDVRYESSLQNIVTSARCLVKLTETMSSQPHD